MSNHLEDEAKFLPSVAAEHAGGNLLRNNNPVFRDQVSVVRVR